MIDKLLTKRNLRIVLLVLGLFVAYSIALSASRAGETKVSIEVIPGDANVFANGQEIGTTAYLSPGEYTFSAAKEGWEDYSLDVSVGEEPVELGLIPEPASAEANGYLFENRDVQLRRETIGGINAQLIGEQNLERFPVLEYLPVDEVTGPFSIDYGFVEDNPKEAFLVISNSSPKGRVAAVNWLRQNGQDPTDIRIDFPDFTNPLVEEGAEDGPF